MTQWLNRARAWSFATLAEILTWPPLAPIAVWTAFWVHGLRGWWLTQVRHQRKEAAWVYHWWQITRRYTNTWADMMAGMVVSTRQLRRVSKQRPGFGFPPAMIWDITDRCNCQCFGCTRHRTTASGSDRLTENQWFDLGAQAIRGGTSTIFLAGGEPLLEKEMIKRIKARLNATFGRRIMFFVFTNGILLTDRDVAEFSRLGIVLLVNIGSDRKPQQEEAAWSAMRRIGANGGFGGAAVVVTEKNWQKVTNEAFLQCLEAAGATMVLHLHYVPSGSVNCRKEDQQFCLTPASFAQTESALLAPAASSLKRLHYSRCSASVCLTVGVDGRVRPCPFFDGPMVLGDVRQDSVEHIWNSAEARAVRLAQQEAGASCLLFNRADWLAEVGLITPELADASRQVGFPPRYLRPFKRGPFSKARRAMWGLSPSKL